MGELRKAAASVLHATSADVEMQGAGRTDAGVHALGTGRSHEGRSAGARNSGRVVAPLQ